MSSLLATGLVSVLLAVSSGDPHSLILTETEFLAAIDPSHPALVEQRQEVAEARARRADAARLANPTLGALREDPDGPAVRTEWTASFQLPAADRGLRVGARERDIEAARARQDAWSSDLRRRLRAVYAAWAVASSRRDHLHAQAHRLRTLARREARRAEAGESSRLEARRLALAASELSSRAALANAEAITARARVETWLPDLAPTTGPTLPALAPTPPEPPRVHPAVRAAEADLAAARLERQAARRFVATPEISLGWLEEGSGRGAASGPLVAVSWSVPLLDRDEPGKALAEARTIAARSRLDLLRQRLASERRAARARSLALRRSLEAARDASAQAEDLLEAAETAFRFGETALTDLLEVRRAVTESALATLDLHAAALEAERDLEALAGQTTATLDTDSPTPMPTPELDSTPDTSTSSLETEP